MQTNIDVAHTLNIWKDETTGSETDYPAGQIDKREKLSRKEFLHEYVLKNRPVVLKDAAQDLKALSRWTPSFFKEKYGSMRFPVLEPKYGAFTVKDKVSLGDYMDEITSSTFENPSRYLFSIQIPNKFPEILTDLEPHPSYWYPNWLESKYLLPGLPEFKLRNITGLEMNIGGTGSQFPFLHFDDLLTQTFVTQVHGRKAWILWTPDQTPYMYPSKESDNVSEIPMDSPNVDLSRFPLFANAKPIRFILEAGEMLYTASGGWWHTTRALSPSIAVVLSTANGPIWSQVTRSAFAKAWKHRRWYFRPAAFPIAAYMTAFGAVKSLTDPF